MMMNENLEQKIDKENEIKPKKVGNPNWVKGVSANPKGRPKGLTIKERIRKWLEEHPDDMESFVKHFVKDNRDLTWRMLEGNPPQKTTIDGELKLPTPILENIPKNKNEKY